MLLGEKTNAEGLREYVVIYGNARVTDVRCATLQVTSPGSCRPVSPESARGVHKAPSEPVRDVVGYPSH